VRRARRNPTEVAHDRSSETLRSISTPQQLQTRLGTLEFVNGVPRSETVQTVYDHLDYVHALNVFLNGYAGASTVALRKGLEEAGADDNQVLIFLELMIRHRCF
jgi:hypothetical protein